MKPRSAKRGAPTSAPEVTSISRQGLSLLLDGRERFLDFKSFPWFREAPVRAVFNVGRPGPGHLHWPDMDVDLEVDSIEHPELYPLVSRAPSASIRERATRAGVAPARRTAAKAPRARRTTTAPKPTAKRPNS